MAKNPITMEELIASDDPEDMKLLDDMDTLEYLQSMDEMEEYFEE